MLAKTDLSYKLLRPSAEKSLRLNCMCQRSSTRWAPSIHQLAGNFVHGNNFIISRAQGFALAV